jgi:hypothetical protein
MRLAAHSTTSPTPTAMGQSFIMTLYMQLVAKKKGIENFPGVNLVLSNCQLIVNLTVPGKYFFKMSLNFDHNSNVFL